MEDLTKYDPPVLNKARSERSEEMWNLTVEAVAKDWKQNHRKGALMAIIQYIRWGEEGLISGETVEDMVDKIKAIIE